MTKDELLEILTGIRATAVLGHVGTEYVMRDLPRFTSEIRGKMFGVRVGEPGRHGYALSLDALADLLSDARNRKVLQSNLNLLMKQDLVRTAYAHIGHYCEEHSCFGLMKAQPWWMFARIIRNTISHTTGARLHQWPDKKVHSVTWNGHTISKTDVGTDIDFAADEAFHLFDEMVGFARALS
jgi:hypothetical protein